MLMFLLTPLNTWAQPNTNHTVIKRYDKLFEVHNKGEATEKVVKTIEVLSEQGAETADLAIFHTKNKSLKSIKGSLRGPDGKLVVKKLDQSNMQDVSGTYVNFYDDYRIRYVRLRHNAFPYTIEYEYEIRHTELFNYPVWYPQDLSSPVERSRFEISYPEREVKPRFKQQNFALQPVITHTSDRTVLVWELNEMQPPQPREPLSPSWQDTAPAVIFSPDIFSFNGRYSGTLDSWQAMGEWMAGLYQNRQSLSPEKVAFLKELTKDEPSPLGKAKKIYEHLQATTRYISIQLGIGGYQPFEASFVEKKQYGDCKALTNYLMAMLQAVEVEAYPAIIKAGDREADIDPDFPVNDFNHVVLALPHGDSFIWLEATSNSLPFGWLSDFTENRYALLLKPNESRLIRTPKTTASQNRQHIKANIVLDEMGNASQTITVLTSGNQASDLRSVLRGKSDKEFAEWFQMWSGIRTPNIQQSDFSSVNKTDSLLQIVVTLENKGFSNKTQNRIFLRPNAYNRRRTSLDKVAQRTTPVRLSYPYRDEDLIQYRLPTGYSLEAISAPISIKTPFAKYESNISASEGGITYQRVIEVYPYHLAPEEYEALRQFYQKVVQADQVQVVLKKNLP